MKRRQKSGTGRKGGRAVLLGGALVALAAVCVLFFPEILGRGSGETAPGVAGYTVGEDIAFDSITDFYYTLDSSTNPPVYQRYRFYAEDGVPRFHHERREGDHWPLTEADATVSGDIQLTGEEWSAFLEWIRGGAVTVREESLDTGDSGPWLYLYWDGDQSVYQAFSFPSYGALTAFEAFCADLASSPRIAYRQISQQEAMNRMAQDDGHVIVDVRRQDEYESGHIPGAILIPNETIADQPPEALPDPDQIILVYCRSGNRSKQAAEKLAAMGYTHVYEFGGILTWPGEIVAGPEPGGNVGGAQSMEVESLKDNDLTKATLTIEANGHTFRAVLENNPSARALAEKLSPQSIQVDMRDYGDFEKVGPLPWSLVKSDQRVTTRPGDVILYQGNQITLYYDQNTWTFTRLAHIEGATREALLDVLGDGDVSVTLSLEWSE